MELGSNPGGQAPVTPTPPYPQPPAPALPGRLSLRSQDNGGGESPGPAQARWVGLALAQPWVVLADPRCPPQPSLCRCGLASKPWEPHKLPPKANVSLRDNDMSRDQRREPFPQLPPSGRTTPALDPVGGTTMQSGAQAFNDHFLSFAGASPRKGSIKSLAKGSILLCLHFSQGKGAFVQSSHRGLNARGPSGKATLLLLLLLFHHSREKTTQPCVLGKGFKRPTWDCRGLGSSFSRVFTPQAAGAQ